MISFVSGSVACLSYSALRTNFFTGITPSSFSVIQCQFGYFIFYFCGFLAFYIFLVTFTYKIQIIFRNSVYCYKDCVYKLFYSLIIISFITFIIDRIIKCFIADSLWILEVANIANSNITVCTLKFVSIDNNKILYYGAPIMMSIMNLFFRLGLLFMFNRGLWLLNREMIKCFVNEFGSNDISHPDAVRSTSSINVVMEQCKEAQTEDGKKKGWDVITDSAQRIINLHNLVKKQTILISIALISSLLWGIWIVFDGTAIIEFGWIFGINVICVWLMLKCSKKYWNWCKVFGLCRCCYTKANW